jgi:hypothetical protein
MNLLKKVELKNDWQASKVQTNWANKYIGDIFNSKTIRWENEEVETQRVLVAYWDIPERAIKLKDELPIETIIKEMEAEYTGAIRIKSADYSYEIEYIHSHRKEYNYINDTDFRWELVYGQYITPCYWGRMKSTRQDLFLTLPNLSDDFFKTHENPNMTYSPNKSYISGNSSPIYLNLSAKWFIRAFRHNPHSDFMGWDRGYDDLKGERIGVNWFPNLPYSPKNQILLSIIASIDNGSSRVACLEEELQFLILYFSYTFRELCGII